MQDVIRSGSENVHAVEVERVLTRHPDVLAAAVVGLPHPHWGEQVCLAAGNDGTDVPCTWTVLHALAVATSMLAPLDADGKPP